MDKKETVFVFKTPKKLEVYGSITQLINDEKPTYKGKKLDKFRLYYQLRKCQVGLKEFDGDNYSIIERKIKRSKHKK